MNSVAERITGWTESEAKEMHIKEVFQIIDEKTRQPVELPIKKVLNAAIIGSENYSLLISRDAKKKYVSVSYSPVKKHNKEITGFVLAIRDQTNDRLNQLFIKSRISLIEYATTHSLKEVLTKALDDISAFVNSPIGFYHFVNDDQKHLTLQQWSTHTLNEYCKAEAENRHYSIDEAGVWVDCVHVKKPVIHNDYKSLPHKKGLPEGHAELIRELVVPVIRNNKVVAILGIGNKPTNYTERDEAIVSYLADLTWEIVQHKRITEEFQNEMNRAQTYLDVAEVIIVALDTNKKVTLINQKGIKILGYEQHEIIGKDWFEKFYPEEIRQKANEQYSKILKEEIDLDERCENPIITKNGEERTIAWHHTLLRNHNKQIIGTLASGEDVTERKKAETALIQSEEKYRSLFAAEADAVLLVDTETMKHMDANEAALQLYGYTREEFLALHSYDVSAEPIETEQKIRLGEIGKIIRVPLRYHKKKDGTVFPVEISASFFEMNEKNTLCAVIRDITSRIKTRDELQKYKDHLEEIVRDRTQELQQKNKELERFNQLFVGREFRIKELKSKIEELEKIIETNK